MLPTSYRPSSQNEGLYVYCVCVRACMHVCVCVCVCVCVQASICMSLHVILRAPLASTVSPISELPLKQITYILFYNLDIQQGDDAETSHSMSPMQFCEVS